MKKIASESHPVFQACLDGNASQVEKHLSEGVDTGSPRLISTALKGGADIVQALIDHGFDINSVFNDFGETAIFRVIEEKNISLLEFFVKNGANVNALDNFGGTPLVRAAGSWPKAIPVLLSAGAIVSSVARKGDSPIYWAAQGGQIESLDLLVSAGADIDEKGKDDTTALMAAAKSGKIEVVKWLLKNGADVYAKDSRGKTALDWAKRNKHEEIALLLQ